MILRLRSNAASDGTVPHPNRFHGGEESSMTEECEHWLVQRRVNDRYWACVDCEAEFRPAQNGPPTTHEIVRRALGRMGLEER
jgi:hypothetical protein